MAKSHWLINSNRTEVKRFIKNDKSLDGVFEYMFVDTGKIVGVFGKEPPVMTTTISVDIDLAREIYERLIAYGWSKTEEVWNKKGRKVSFTRMLNLYLDAKKITLIYLANKFYRFHFLHCIMNHHKFQQFHLAIPLI